MSVRTGILILAMLVVSAALWAADDPMMGSWKLNVAKSKYNPGPAPSPSASPNINKYEPSGNDGMKLTVDGVDAQGKPTHSEYSAQYDGKDYPWKGSTSFDAVALKRIDAYTSLTISKKGGKVVRLMIRTASKDGKTHTADQFGVDAQGKPYHNIVVYDKQ